MYQWSKLEKGVASHFLWEDNQIHAYQGCAVYLDSNGLWYDYIYECCKNWSIKSMELANQDPRGVLKHVVKHATDNLHSWTYFILPYHGGQKD